MVKHVIKKDYDAGFLIETPGTWIFAKSSQIHGVQYGIHSDPVDNVTISFSGKVDASTMTSGSAISGWGSHFTVVIEKSGVVGGATDAGVVAHEAFADLENKGSIRNVGYGISSLAGLSEVGNSGKISALVGFDLLGGITTATNRGTINVEIGIRATGSDYDIKNSGNIIARDGDAFVSHGIGIQLEGGLSEIVNSGRIKAAVGISADGADNAVSNRGEIEASEHGIELIGGNNKVVNNGTISGSRGIYADGLDNIVINGKSGKIIADFGYSTNGAFGGSGDFQESVTFTNHGLIKSTTAFASAGNSTPSLHGQELLNDGTIKGTISTGSAHDVIENSGSIIGDIDTGTGSDRVSNSRGTINGDIDLGAGYDAFDLTGGKFIGQVFGGTEDDTYQLNNSKVEVIELAGGGDADIIFSTASFVLPDYVEDLTLLGKKNINATGNDAVNTIVGNAGGNVIIGGADGGDTMDGRKGNDRITGGLLTDTIIFRTGDGKDIITNFAVDDGNSNHTDILDLSDWTEITSFQDLSSQDHLKEVNGNAVIFAGNDSITLQGVSAEQLTSAYFHFV